MYLSLIFLYIISSNFTGLFGKFFSFSASIKILVICIFFSVFIFIFFMLILITVDNFLELFLGWEGIGFIIGMLVLFTNLKTIDFSVIVTILFFFSHSFMSYNLLHYIILFSFINIFQTVFNCYIKCHGKTP